MSNKRKKADEDAYSKRHIRRIICQQTLNDLNEIHSRIFSKDNFAESSTNAGTYYNGAMTVMYSSQNLQILHR